MKKLVHQIWIGDQPMNVRLSAYCDTVRNAFPDRQYKLWTDADLPDLAKKARLPGVVLNPDGIHSLGIRADVIRLEILRQHGGVYLDCDYEALRPDLEPLLDHGATFLYGDEKAGKPLNALMSVNFAGHPFVEFYLQRITSQLKPSSDLWDAIRITGPERLSECLSFWVGNWSKSSSIAVNNRRVGTIFGEGSVSSLWNETACPYGFASKESYATFNPANYPSAWLAHHWEGGWRKE